MISASSRRPTKSVLEETEQDVLDETDAQKPAKTEAYSSKVIEHQDYEQ